MRYYKHLYLTEGLEKKKKSSVSWKPVNCSQVCM